MWVSDCGPDEAEYDDEEDDEDVDMDGNIPLWDGQHGHPLNGAYNFGESDDEEDDDETDESDDESMEDGIPSHSKRSNVVIEELHSDDAAVTLMLGVGLQ